jgi:hypothetical protein
MYHPIVFRTGVCRNSSNCMFGKRCGRAHSDVQLRNQEDTAESYYKDSFQPALPAKTVASSLDLSSLSQGKPNFDILAMKVWKETHLSPTKVSLKIAEHLWFAVNQSNELFSRIQEAAFEECLGTVDRKVVNKLIIRSIDHDGIRARIQSLLDESSPYFVSRILRYGKRIISNLRELKTSDILPSKNLLIQYFSDGKLRMTAVRVKGDAANAAELLLENAVDKLKFWIEREGYDNFYSCGCCCESFNMDQGIICENGHFYCSKGEEDGEQCFDSLVKSQILQLSNRKDFLLLCPECDASYKKKGISSNLSDEVYDQYQKAVVDAKVTKKTEEMNNIFNERLQSAVAEVLATHGNAELRLLVEAKNLAREARNTVLNLRCPHCENAYFDFAGCMAIQCKR